MDAGRRAGSGRSEEPGRDRGVEGGGKADMGPGAEVPGRGTPPAPKGRLTVARNSDRPAL